MWIFTDHDYLLRVAPWADIDEIKSKLIAKIETAKYHEKFNYGVQKYLNGEACTLPNTWQLRDHIYSVLNENYSCFSVDVHWSEVSGILVSYFFRPEFWIKADSEEA